MSRCRARLVIYPEYLPDGLPDKGGQYRLIPNAPGIAPAETVAASKGVRHLEQISSQFRRCSTLWLKESDDRITVNGYALYHKAGQRGTAVGRILEILVNHDEKRVIGVLVHEYTISEVVRPYRFPSLVPTEDLYEFLAYDVSFDSIRFYCSDTTRMFIGASL